MQSPSLSPKIFIKYHGKDAAFTVGRPVKHHLNQGWHRQGVSTCCFPDMGVTEKIINNIPVAFVSKMYIPNLYVRKNQTNPNGEAFYKITQQYSSKSVKTIKDKDKEM